MNSLYTPKLNIYAHGKLIYYTFLSFINFLNKPKTLLHISFAVGYTIL